MNRIAEYEDLLAELDNTPSALEYTVARARARMKRAHWIRRFSAVPIGGVFFFLAFTVLVNISVPFAMACGRIPLLRELAAAVAFSPSLSAAVENEYVQPIELEQSQSDITMRIEYVIVDQKQLNIFYSLQSSVYSRMSASPSISMPDGTALGGYGISTGGFDEKNGELRLFVVDFVEADVPESILLTCRVHDNGVGFGSEEAPVSVQDELFQSPKEMEPEYITVFEFVLDFQPSYTQQGEIVELNQSFILDGQRLTASTVEIYPTHMRLNLEDDEANTAWLQSISFYCENEKGRRFDAISNGISATGSEGSPMMRSHRLESSFFSESKSLELHITEAVWLDKAMERVKVDLVNETAESLPQGVALEEALRKERGWELTFSGAEIEEDHSYQLFGSYYYDENGNEYMYNVWSSGMSEYYNEELGEYVETPGRFLVRFALVDYPYDSVYLSPSFSRRTELAEAVVIHVK